MKKLITLLSVFLLTCSLGFAQYYYIPHLTPSGTNPGGLNSDPEYPMGGGMATGWASVINGPQATPVWSTVQHLPSGYSFSFNGTPVTAYMISSSGVLTFDTATIMSAPTLSNAGLPSASVPNNSVCVWGLSVNTDLTGFTVAAVSKTFGTAPNRQYWITYAGVQIPGTASSWTFWSIVLEETTNRIYIVDQRSAVAATGLTLGVQIDNTTATEVTGSPNINAISTTDPTQADNVYYEFNAGPQPAFDASVFSVTMADYLLLSAAPFTVSCNLQNFGTAALTSVVLNYSINGGATVASSPVSVSIPTFGSSNVSHTVSWNPTSTGTYVINVWASDLNGNADMVPSNDAHSKSVIVVNAVTQRLPTFEVFTSATCGPCAAAAPNLDAVFTANPNKFNCIKYQMNWPGTGDIYYNADGETRRAYYGLNSIPTMYVDGVIQNEATYSSPMLNSQYAVPSFMEIVPYYTVVNKKVTVTGNINPLADFPASSNLRMHIGVFEFTTTGNVATNGETEFFYVEKKMIPSGTGTAITSLTASTPYAINKSYTFPSNSTVEQYTDLGVIVFVQNNVTKEIYQSALATEPPANGIANTDKPGTGIVKLFPNPVRGNSVLIYQMNETRNVSVSVVNTLGQTVYSEDFGSNSAGAHQADMKLSALPAGLYTVKLNLGDQVHSTKLLKVE